MSLKSLPIIPALFLSLLPVLSGCSSALVDAAKDGRTDAVRTLLPGDRAHCGKALWVAADHDRADAIAALLDGGCDVNAKDHDGYTPLMFAGKAGNIEAIRVLLSRKADSDPLTWNDKTAAQLARERGHKDAAALIDRGPVIAFAAALSPSHRLIYDLFRRTRDGDKKAQARAAAAVLRAGVSAVPELERAVGGEGVVEDLDASLKGKDIRLIAIQVLGLMGPTAAGATPALTAALDDPDLRDAAQVAIRRIGRGKTTRP